MTVDSMDGMDGNLRMTELRARARRGRHTGSGVHTVHTVHGPASAIARHLDVGGVVLRVEARFLVGRIRALFGTLPELRALRDEFLACLRSLRGTEAPAA
jgi:hypothetical protein